MLTHRIFSEQMSEMYSSRIFGARFNIHIKCFKAFCTARDRIMHFTEFVKITRDSHPTNYKLRTHGGGTVLSPDSDQDPALRRSCVEAGDYADHVRAPSTAHS